MVRWASAAVRSDKTALNKISRTHSPTLSKRARAHAVAVRLVRQCVVDRTNMPFSVRDRKFSITSALSIVSHIDGATPNSRVACGLVNLSAGISRYSARTSCSSAAGGGD